MSADRNAEYLAQHHRANIVISTSAMKVLADNYGPDFDKEWDIPVEVKSYVVKGKTLFLLCSKSHLYFLFLHSVKKCIVNCCIFSVVHL